MGAVKDHLCEMLNEMLCDAAGGDRETINFLIQNTICWRCSEHGFQYLWRVFDNGQRAIEVRCAHCGKFIEWARQTPTAIELANANGIKGA